MVGRIAEMFGRGLLVCVGLFAFLLALALAFELKVSMGPVIATGIAALAFGWFLDKLPFKSRSFITKLSLSVSIAVGAAFVMFKITSPPGGYINLAYDGSSASGVFLELENRSTQAIYLKGRGDKLWPGTSHTTCNDLHREDSDPITIADGNPGVIKVSAGGQLRLDVDTQVPSEFKHGFCHVRVSLLGGAFIETGMFMAR